MESLGGIRDAAGRRPRVFNTAFESGLRSLVLLTQCYPDWLGLRRLVALDYMLVHTADVQGPPSLHPQEDSRVAELLVRRKLVGDGLSLMATRGLVVRSAMPSGFRYRAGEEAGSFVDLLRSKYSLELKSRASWLQKNLASLSEEHFEQIVRGQIDEWAAEFQVDTKPLA
jgi:hypothetical protein